MRKNKLTRLLQSLDSAAWNRFQDFVASPYFSGQSAHIAFLKALGHHWPEFEVDKESVFRQAFPEQPYADKQFRYLSSDLTRLMEQFLAIEWYRQQPQRQDLDTLRALAERGLDKEYAHVQRRILDALEERPEHDVAYYEDQYRLSIIQQRQFELARHRAYDPSLQRATDYLDRGYFLRKLKYGCAMLDRQQVIQGQYDPKLTSELIHHIEQMDFFGEQVIFYYYNVLLALQEEDNEAHYDRLRVLLRTPPDKVPRGELRDLYFFVINYCARKIRKGKDRFVREALDFYREGIDRGLLLDQGQLSPWTYTNVVKLSLRQKEYDWIKSFIRDMAPLLPETYRSDALHYNLAETYYYTREHGKALEHLNQVHMSDLNFHLGSRVLLAKVYYEEGEEEALLSLIAAFTMFLKRNKKLSQTIKKTYLNFCRMLFRILKRKTGQWGDLAEALRTTRLLTDRQWLMEVLEREADETVRWSS